jgi:hypothetical protein
MASWQRLREHVRANYRVDAEAEGLLKIIYEFDAGRTQIVLVNRESIGATDWAQLASPFAQAAGIDLTAVLDDATLYKVGGVIKVGEELWVRHSVPLAQLDIAEFEWPLDIVARAADALEQKYVGDDRY